MNFNFELILFYATLLSGAIALLDILFLQKKRQAKKIPIWIDYARSFFPVLLIVFLLRSFLFEPFRIPSGSLEPTLLVNEFILVNKFDYGIRLPVIHQKIIGKSTPKRGDIIVFRWPPNPSLDFIKRVIGLPGDRIQYVNKELYINDQKIPQDFLQMNRVNDESGELWQATEKEENLFGVKHKIYIDPEKFSGNFSDIVVPDGMYFVMGDNRDNSADSRFWGFVPDENIIGKAVVVWMSWDNSKTNIRWNRLGKVIR
ncbi:MAG: signal peptidase I [Gammaproteobacteria bacterium RIFCSPHIGHO2_12_FULL_37_34]|nr:MAG: signal peptidase I [Gammaproteobacteria bacterium RIFCSPHIGHO2_12_FULL_37_34]